MTTATIPPVVNQKRSVYLPSSDRPRRLRSVPVLVVLHPDNYVEVFGPDHVQVVVVNRLDSEADATLIDQYLEGQIPRAHQAIYFPRNLRGTGLLERITTSSESCRLDALNELREIRTWGAMLREEVA